MAADIGADCELFVDWRHVIGPGTDVRLCRPVRRPYADRWAGSHPCTGHRVAAADGEVPTAAADWTDCGHPPQPGSHRHRVGQDRPTKVNRVRNSGGNDHIHIGSSLQFLPRANSENPAVSTGISNFVAVCWPILSYPVAV